MLKDFDYNVLSCANSQVELPNPLYGVGDQMPSILCLLECVFSSLARAYVFMTFSRMVCLACVLVHSLSFS